jgi:hypothetical protein
MDCSDLPGVFTNAALTEANATPSLADEVTKISSDAKCEETTVSKHSPGPVAPAEPVIRMIFSPHMISRESGKVTEAAFSDVKNRGMSVLRGEMVSDEEIEAQASEKIAADRARGKSATEYQGFIVATTEKIREIDQESRAFAIYDSAKANNKAHADVVQILTRSDSALKRMRRELQKKFNEVPFRSRSAD